MTTALFIVGGLILGVILGLILAHSSADKEQTSNVGGLLSLVAGFKKL